MKTLFMTAHPHHPSVGIRGDSDVVIDAGHRW
jgi:hypothetical protein